jgi:predicted transcriptional regulator
MTIKRAKVTSGRVARSLGVSERDVTLWRAGVTVPKSKNCERLSELLDVDVAWLCASEV